MLMGKGCRCPHHIVQGVFHVLAGLFALGFFVVVFRRMALFGWSADIYFMSAIMLVVMAGSGKMCRCCRGHWGMMQKEGMDPMKCDHQNCTCGNCEDCK